MSDVTDSLMGVATTAVTAGVVMKIADKALGANSNKGGRPIGRKKVLKRSVTKKGKVLKPASVKGIPCGLPKFKGSILTKPRQLPRLGTKFDSSQL